MQSFVQIKDKSGKILVRVEGPKEDLLTLHAKAINDLTIQLRDRLLASVPDDLERPLTVELGDIDA